MVQNQLNISILFYEVSPECCILFHKQHNVRQSIFKIGNNIALMQAGVEVGPFCT